VAGRSSRDDDLIMVRRCAVLLLVPAAGVVAGCSSLSAPDVRDVAAAFAAGDPAARCAMTAASTVQTLEREEQQPCVDAVAQLPLGTGPVVSVDVWGEDALVHLTDDTLFLTLSRSGWQISAGACEPQPDAPYVCQLEAS
jgi:hypothetical protein